MMPRIDLSPSPQVTFVCAAEEGRRLLEALQRASSRLRGEWPLFYATLHGRRLTGHWAPFAGSPGKGKLLLAVEGKAPREGLGPWLESVLGPLPAEYQERNPGDGEQTALSLR